jgi:hypothetical protein
MKTRAQRERELDELLEKYPELKGIFSYGYILELEVQTEPSPSPEIPEDEPASRDS